MSNDLRTRSRSRRRAPQLHNSLRAGTFDGTLHAGMLGFGEAYFAAYALLLGATSFQVGLLTTVPILIGSVFQMVSPAAARWLGAQPWVVASAAGQAAVLAVVAWLAGSGRDGYWLLLTLVSIYWALGLGINPAWNSWMGRMIPARLRSRYFGRRNAPIQAALFLSVLAGGLLIHAAESSVGGAAAGFAGAFALAAMCRLGSTWFLTRQHDPKSKRSAKPLGFREVVGGLRREPYGRLLVLLVLMSGSVHISAAYFTPFMLEGLGLSYAEFTFLNAAIVASRVIASPYWGEIARNYGNRRALQVSTSLLVPLSALWILSDNFAYLVGLQILAGFSWAGFELATVLNILDCTEDENRAQVLTIYNIANGILIVAGSLLGGVILLQLGDIGYRSIFLLSGASRAFCVLVFARGVGRLRPGAEHSFRDVFSRVITFRPGQGAIVRPVVMPEKSRRG